MNTVTAQAVLVSVHQRSAPFQAPRETPIKVWAECLNKLVNRYSDSVVHVQKGRKALALRIAVDLQPGAPRAFLQHALPDVIYIRVASPRLRTPLVIVMSRNKTSVENMNSV